MNKNAFVLALSITALSACISDHADHSEMDANDAAVATQSSPVTFTTGACSNNLSFDQDLLIRAVAVVDDPRARGMGPWSFGGLMTKLAGPRNPQAFVREWLSTFEQDQTVTPPGGQALKVHANKRNADSALIDPWPKDGAGNIRLDVAPFRLLAIVYRPDLADASSAGEVRFVFGATDPRGDPMTMTAAFEYRIPAGNASQAGAFARAWHMLSAYPVGSAEYLALLNQWTENVTNPGLNPGGVNGSALGQIRTNEVAIDTPWDQRQYVLTGANGGTLTMSSLPGTPRLGLNGSDTLGNLLKNGFQPGSLPAHLQAADSVIPSKEFAWQKMPGASNGARHDFAMTTCNGCHSAETGTKFMQIVPRSVGSVAQISKFLGSSSAAPFSVKDPVAGGKHTFMEQDRRLQAYNNLLCTP